MIKPTIVLMALILVGFLVGIITYSVSPYLFSFLIQVNYLVLRGDYLSLITSIFVTNSFTDFIFNFFSMGVIYYLFGSKAGKLEYVVFLVSGLMGNILTLIFFPPYVASAGASGGIFGVLAYYILDDMLEFNRFDWNGLALLIIVFVLSDIIPGVNYVAHIGGIVGGVILAVGRKKLLGDTQGK
ncbi:MULTISPECIES: rhomboid family intramembrane serine protease [Metallosphaera]|uniref:rhomboid family intramembrane serine protease n=1 Tax=Metallosphaera TaxID=41980 RepID=UPI001F06453F|nr:rhomboid family intramembrane serine protease [Metallosphaera sedula]MCH1770554.1 rhomboid family intramembrane serine protease [Metallosphaera sedula]MCP6728752.1 rhomboid family intramembrane serine protease [Metallosphaera sedula]